MMKCVECEKDFEGTYVSCFLCPGEMCPPCGDDHECSTKGSAKKTNTESGQETAE